MTSGEGQKKLFSRLGENDCGKTVSRFYRSIEINVNAVLNSSA